MPTTRSPSAAARCSREDAPAILGRPAGRLAANVRETTRVPLGIYRGLRFGLVLHPQFPPDVYLEGAITRQATLSRDHHGPRAVLNALERLAGGYGSECDRVRQDLAIAEAQLRDYQARLGKPFPHDAYLAELTSLRDQLKAGLSGAAQSQATKTGPSVSELAEQIKALKAAHTIEAAPQRIQRKESTAEEPVTARIRRRQEANTESGEEAQLDGDPRAQDTMRPEAREGAARKPPRSFQERIALERQNKDQGPDLP